MKPKQLESHLSRLQQFKTPKILLEQYATPADIATQIISLAHANGDVEDKRILDLGAGCGMLSAGSVLMGASQVVAVEICVDAVEHMKSNFDILDVSYTDPSTSDVIIHNCDFREFNDDKSFDTAILNPPFGTKKNAGLDTQFLLKAFVVSSVVYSLHKTSTRSYICQIAYRNGFDAKVVAELKYNLDSTYRFHKQKSVDVLVDCICFTRSQTAVNR